MAEKNTHKNTVESQLDRADWVYPWGDSEDFRKSLGKLFDESPLGMAVGDQQRRFRAINASFCSMLGYTEAELLGKTTDWITFCDDQAVTSRMVSSILEGHGPVNYTKRLVRKDGTILWARISNTALKGTFPGDPVCYFGIVEDITKQIEAEEALRESEARFHVLADAAYEGIVLHTSNRIVDVNRSLLHMLGFESRDELIGKNVVSLASPSWRRRMFRFMDKEQPSRELELIRKDGQSLWVELRGKRIRNLGRDAHVLAILDISRRKIAEDNLRKLAWDLAASNRALEEFAYRASHDMKEPLRMISSYLTLVSQRCQGKLDADAERFIGIAVLSVKRIQSLVDNLLSLSRVTKAGSLPAEQTDASEALRDALTNLELSLSDSGSEVTQDHLPIVMSNKSQLTHVFQTLIENAIKFKSKRLLRIHISAVINESEVIFCVRDNGIGYPNGKTDPIGTNSGSPGPAVGDFGLGLCEKIIDRLGGRLWVRSEVGVGSQFYFTLKSATVDMSDRG